MPGRIFASHSVTPKPLGFGKAKNPPAVNNMPDQTPHEKTRVRVCRLTAMLLILSFLNLPSFASPRAVLLADMNTGAVIYQENASVPNYPASLTKLMTLYLTFDALERGRLTEGQSLIVSQRAANQPAMKLGLRPGEKITVQSAIHALIIRSANDVATVLSENLKGDEGDFSDMMTKAATEIGLRQTNFENASGLPGSDHISSARDMALLAIAIYQHFPQYFHYFNIRSFQHGGRTFTTHNNILRTYPGANGMKTGFTNRARYNLAATAGRGDTQLIAIVLGSDNTTQRANVATKLLDYGFAIRSGQNPGSFASFRPSSVSVDTTSDEADDLNNNIPSRSNNVTPAKATPGNAGLQFGAFGSRQAAQTQSDRIRRIFGLNPTIEPYNNLFRVRVHNLSENSAADLKRRADRENIPAFIFR